MRNHEKKQEDESREDYVRRISKFPILSPSTIMRVVFPTVRLGNVQYIKDCARSVFPKAFPVTDLDGSPFIFTYQTTYRDGSSFEDVSTKAFAKWVVEENIFEAWIALGEKVSHSAELFIKLVNGKAIDSKQASKEVSLKSPRPGIGRVKMNRLHEDYVSAAKKMLDINSKLKWPDFKDSPKLKNLIRDSGLSPSESTLQRKWVDEARQVAKVKGTPGAPKKK
jgi:hypothetical protein